MVYDTRYSITMYDRWWYSIVRLYISIISQAWVTWCMMYVYDILWCSSIHRHVPWHDILQWVSVYSSVYMAQPQWPCITNTKTWHISTYIGKYHMWMIKVVADARYTEVGPWYTLKSTETHWGALAYRGRKRWESLWLITLGIDAACDTSTGPWRLVKHQDP